MQKAFWLAVVTLAGITFAPVASAWTDSAMNKQTGYVYTSANLDTRDEAVQGALRGCAEQGNAQACIAFKPLNETAYIVVRGKLKVGMGDQVSVAGDPDPDKAAKAALANCRSADASGCQIRQAFWDTGHRWMAVAYTKDTARFVQQYDSKDAAESAAVAECNKQSITKDCRIFDGFSVPGKQWVASFSSYIGRSSVSEANAVKAAREACEDNPLSNQQLCSSAGVKTLIADAPKPAPKAFTKLETALERDQARASRVQHQANATTYSTNVLRCRNQCMNGRCIRTFDDGRKEVWQAPRVYDSFNNNWTWDTTTNACGS